MSVTLTETAMNEHRMIVDPATVLRIVAKDLRDEAPCLTVGDLFDESVRQLVEDGTDWRDLSTKRPDRADRALAHG